jgi:NAD(P)-dependent dehydrogenase (short-subunit alcohol dehydrogenase family)
MRTVLVTGATDGIGLETARQLLAHGAQVIIHGRSAERLGEAERSLRAGTPAGSILSVSGDLAVMDEVLALSERVLALGARLDVVINNAGVYETQRRLTADGFERTLAVNHFAPFLLTQRLLPTLIATGQGRVVNVSSIAHTQASADFSDLAFERSYSAYRAYALSKLANILFTRELARRLAGHGCVANCLHPGVISTKLLAAGFNMAGDTLERGARTSVFLAESEEGGRISGAYFENCRQAASSLTSQDEHVAAELWQLSEEVLKPWL